MRPGPKNASTPPEIKPQWDTAFQYAGPLPPKSAEKKPGKLARLFKEDKPAKNNVPVDRAGFNVSPQYARVTPNLRYLQPGASVDVQRDPADTGKPLVKSTAAHQQYETLKYYDRNFPDQVSRGKIPTKPTADIPPTEEDRRAMGLFQEEVKRNNTEGNCPPRGNSAPPSAPTVLRPWMNSSMRPAERFP